MKLSQKEIISELIGDDKAKKLYDIYGSSLGILNVGESDYIRAGLSKKEARTLYLSKYLSPEFEVEQIKASLDAYNIVKDMMHHDVENFVAIPLSRKNIPLTKPIIISTGGVSATVVDMKVMFRKLLEIPRISAFFVAHNHPSGQLLFSSSDLDLTKKIIEAGLLLDLKMIDHIIVGINGYTSYIDEGYM